MILFNCKELAKRSTRGEFDAAGWFTRLLIRMHTVMCEGCRRYGAQLKAVADAVREQARSSVSPGKADALKEKVMRRLSP